MNIVTALNRKYIPYTTVMLLSLGMNNEEEVDAYLLNSELTAEDISLMQETLSEYGVTVHSIVVDRGKFSDKLPRNEQWSIETYYRLMMLELLPESLDRILYLDGDMIINGSLKDLYYLPFDGKEIIAADDKCGLNQPETYGPKNNEMLSEAYRYGYRYFNAGMMLMNYAELRKNYSFQIYVKAFEAWDYQMEAPDQDILNWVHWKKVGYVDCQKYNLFARVAHNAGITYDEVKKAVTIIHYPGYKPWENGNVHFDIEKLWWEYAEKSPFYISLMEHFIESAMVDTTLEDTILELTEKNAEQMQLLDQIMAKMKQFM
ncbi:MAG: glycosyltransferase family 8 protein [Lachnospiraceae bacterium]|nr:glycosyltransferase family 8 protein [Lachnospiraceae bacterium]